MCSLFYVKFLCIWGCYIFISFYSLPCVINEDKFFSYLAFPILQRQKWFSCSACQIIGKRTGLGNYRYLLPFYTVSVNIGITIKFNKSSRRLTLGITNALPNVTKNHFIKYHTWTTYTTVGHIRLVVVDGSNPHSRWLGVSPGIIRCSFTDLGSMEDWAGLTTRGYRGIYWYNHGESNPGRSC